MKILLLVAALLLATLKPCFGDDVKGDPNKNHSDAISLIEFGNVKANERIEEFKIQRDDKIKKINALKKIEPVDTSAVENLNNEVADIDEKIALLEKQIEDNRQAIAQLVTNQALTKDEGAGGGGSGEGGGGGGSGSGGFMGMLAPLAMGAVLGTVIGASLNKEDSSSSTNAQAPQPPPPAPNGIPPLIPTPDPQNQIINLNTVTMNRAAYKRMLIKQKRSEIKQIRRHFR